jgi:cell division protein FtsQ
MHVGKGIFISIGSVLLAIFLIISYNYLKDPQKWPIKVVSVRGELQYLEREAIEQIATPYVSKSFLLLDVRALREALLGLPWVAEVLIEKQWPESLVITVREKKPVARWNNSAFLTTLGEVFEPRALPTEALAEKAWPDLNGPLGQEKAVWQHYQIFQTLFLPMKTEVTNVTLSETLAWNMTLSTGLRIVIGRDNVENRLTRFLQVLRENPNLLQQDYVDLRYAHGFAVGPAKINYDASSIIQREAESL